MSVSRTDYLMWGAKVSPDNTSYEDFEAELYQEDGARFDIIKDNMSGEYAVAGKIIAQSDPHEGLVFTDVESALNELDKLAVIDAVMLALPEAKPSMFKLLLFSHYR